MKKINSTNQYLIKSKKVAIIGAGPAGCMCAYFAKEHAQVTLFDFKTPLSTLLCTGGGRCNLAYAEYDFRELARFYPRGEKFLYSVLSRFSTADTIEFFEEIGVKTYTQDDLRIFPVSNSATKVRSSMLHALSECSFVKEKVVRISTLAPCGRGVGGEGNRFCIESDKDSYAFDSVVIAVGGHAGFELAKGLGHNIVAPKPALCGLVGYVAENSMQVDDLQSRLGLPTQQQKVKKALNSPFKPNFSAIQGVSLKDIEARFYYYTPHPKPSPSRGEGVEQNSLSKLSINKGTKPFGRQSPSSEEGICKGDLIFTHEGISGPLAYKISSICARKDYNKNNPLIIKLNLLRHCEGVNVSDSCENSSRHCEGVNVSDSCDNPSRHCEAWISGSNNECPPKQSCAHSYADEILKRVQDDVGENGMVLQRLLNSNPKKDIKNLVGELVPKSLAEYILKINGIALDKKCCEIDGVERDRIFKALTEFEISVISPSKEGEVVTSGGVCLDEVNAKTMESKLVDGLYFCGEVLDIDGFCGGFNLQNCWSTGYIAGNSI